MEYIEKNNSLESAKNRLDISGLTYLTITGNTGETAKTLYVYDRLVSSVDDKLKKSIPFVETSGGYVLRYKNLTRQYYWLINEFIPSCSYEKLCMRNGEKQWIEYKNVCDVFRETFVFNYLDNTTLIASTTILKGDKANSFTPSKIGYVFSGWTTEEGGSEFFDFDTSITANTNVYAVYETKKINITFMNGNEVFSSITVNYGQIPSEPSEDPTKPGFTFVGWYPSIVVATTDATYIATYTEDMYVVRFFNINNPDDILTASSQPIHSGDVVDRTKYRILKTETLLYGERSEYYLNMPTYEHFVCSSDWIDQDGNDISASSFLNVTHDIDAYPKLIKKEYTVTFLNWNNELITGDTFTNPQTIEYMGDATAPEDEPVRENYNFIGWDKSLTGISSDTIIHAQYEGVDLHYEYVLPTLEGQDYILYYSGDTQYNSVVHTVQNPSTEVFDPYEYGVFDGWYVDSGYTEQWDITTHITSDTIIYGKWKTQFEVSFYNWDGTLITGDTVAFENPVYVEYGDDVPDEALEQIIMFMEDKPGYEFLGWNKSTTGITYDVKITAVYDDTQMCVVSFINDITGEVFSSTTVPFGTTILVSEYPEPPINEHYNFANWEGDTSEVFSNTEVYAKYELVDVTVHFVDYYGNELGTTTVKYGTSGNTLPYLYVPNIQERLDMDEHPEILSTLEFNGVFCCTNDRHVCNEFEDTEITDETNTFKAQYEVISTETTTCTIKFYNYDSTYWFQDTVLYGTVLDDEYSQGVLNIFAENGYGPDPEVYTFYGWSDGTGNVYINGINDLTVTRDVLLTAQFRMITYTVRFYVQRDPVLYPENVDLPIPSLTTEVIKGAALDRPDCSNVPERIYFETFCEGTNNRWYTEPTCSLEPGNPDECVEWVFKQDIQGTPVQNPTPITGNTILYGKYVGREYTLTFDANIEGNEPTVLTFRYPTPTNSITNPTKEGATFMGWYTDNGTFENQFTFGEPLNGDTIIYAKWFEAVPENIIIYNAIYDISTSSALQVMYGKNLVAEQCMFDWSTGDGILVYDGELTEIHESNFSEVCEDVYSITIPKSIHTAPNFRTFSSLREINVVEDNEYYASIDGVLFSKQLIWLNSYPRNARNSDYVIPNTVEKINGSAFAYCETLKSVVIPDSVELVLPNAFKECSELRSVDIESESISLQNCAFGGCDKMTSITCKATIPPIISSETFEYVPRSAKLYVPCASIDEYRNADIWSEFDIQTCIGTILYLNNDTTVMIYDNILTREEISEAFGNLIIAAEVGENVTEIYIDAFHSCEGLTSVTIGSNVAIINNYAFYGCTGLENINIPGNVTTIGNGAFNNCNSLNSLYIPYNVSSIGNSTFNGCTNLRSITCDRLIPPAIGNAVFDNTNNCPIYVPCESIEDYKAAPNWSNYQTRMRCIGTVLYLNDNTSVVIYDNILTEAAIASQYSNRLVAAQVGANVTSIDYSAFQDCTMLTSVTIPYSVTSMGNAAFYGCSALLNIEFSEGLEIIGQQVFKNCVSLNSIQLPESLTTIGSNTFGGCTSLKHITIPPYVSILTEDLFYNCTSLSSVTISGNLASIGDRAFDTCRSLQEISIPDTVTGIGEDAFRNCTHLTTANIPTGLTSISDGLFYNCSELSNVIISNGVTTIGAWAFKDCDTFTNISVPSSVSEIDDAAFIGCSNLLNLEIGSGITSIGSMAFGGCTNLSSITCNATYVPEMGTNVFGDLSIDPVPSSCKVYVPCESVALYEADSQWGRLDIQTCSQTGTTLYLSDSSTVVIPDNVLTQALISDVYRNTLVACEVGNNVAAIDKGAFENCYSLTSVTISDSVTSIGCDAFYYCYALKSIEIPNNVAFIGDYAFLNCTSLTYVQVNCIAPPELGERCGRPLLPGQYYSYAFANIYCNIFVPCVSIIDYLSDSEWSNYSHKIYCRDEVTVLHLNNGSPDVVITADTLTQALISDVYSGTVVACEIGDNVTTIDTYAFLSCQILTSVTIPNSVITLGEGAFGYCNSLISVTIPDSVTSVGVGVFWGAIGLTSVEIGSGLTSIGQNMFAGCGSLNEVIIPSTISSIDSGAFIGAGISAITIPNTVTNIAMRAFQNCDNLVSIELPNSITGISNQLFYGCDNLSSVTIPNSVITISGEAFRECINLTDVTIPSSVSQIENGAFNQCESITSITIPDSVTIINHNTFASCEKLNDVKIGSGITIIGEGAFGNCYSLTSVTIPDNVSQISQLAFSTCTGLTNIEMGNGITSIGDRAFEDCTGLLEITCNATTPPTLGPDVFNNVPSSCKLYVPCESVALYQAAAQWQDLDIQTCPQTGTTLYLNDSTTVLIENNALTQQRVSDLYSGTLIGVKIGSNVTNIYNNTFYNCYGLTSITIPDNVTNIDGAFSYCTGLTSVEIGRGVTGIGYGTFSNCYSLVSIDIPNTISSINENAFVNCYSLSSITIPDSVTTVGDFVFQNCSGLTNVEIGSGLSVLGNYMFTCCYALTSITIPDTVSELGYWTFQECTGLTNVEIGSGVTTINGGTFADCYSLTSITIPGNVVNIGARSFNNCTGLVEITCNATTPPNLVESAFDSATYSNATLYVPSGSISNYASARPWGNFDNIQAIP